MNTDKPMYVGKFSDKPRSTVTHTYIEDEHIALGAGDLVGAETIQSVVIEVTDAAGTVVVGMVPAAGVTVSDTQVDFQITSPLTAGIYDITAHLTLSDGQHLKRHARQDIL